RGQLDHHEVDGEVPGGDEPADADGVLLDDRFRPAGGKGADVLGVEPLGERGEVAGDAGGVRGGAQGLGDGGAVLTGVGVGEVLRPGLDLVRDPQQVTCAFAGCQRGPLRQGPAGGGDGRV